MRCRVKDFSLLLSKDEARIAGYLVEHWTTAKIS